MAPVLAFQTRSPEETAGLARRLALLLKPGDCLGLSGDLGAGKTVFAGSLKEALNTEGDMQSPTFTMLRSYESKAGGPTFHHFDAYRLTGADDWYDLGFADIVDRDGISLIEWADLVAEALPPSTIYLKITPVFGQDGWRQIEIRFPEGDKRADLKF